MRGRTVVLRSNHETARLWEGSPTCFVPSHHCQCSGELLSLTSPTFPIISPSFDAHGAARPADAGETASSTRRRWAGQGWTTGSDKCCVSGITQLEQWIPVTPLWIHYSELADDKAAERATSAARCRSNVFIQVCGKRQERSSPQAGSTLIKRTKHKGSSRPSKKKIDTTMRMWEEF